jgi:septum formation protein
MSALQKLVLASGSPRRVELLAQAGHRARPAVARRSRRDAAEIRTSALAGTAAEPRKGRKILGASARSGRCRRRYVLAADTVVAVGRQIMPKAEMLDEASQCLRMLSGRNHKVYTGLCLITPKGKIRQKIAETRVRFKRDHLGGAGSLSRVGRMARQGGRLRHPGACRHLRRAPRRLLHQCRRPAALRDGLAA